MFGQKGKIRLFLLIGYLSFALAVIPGHVSGALLDSEESGSESNPGAVLKVAQMIEAGFSFAEASSRVDTWTRDGLISSYSVIRMGGEPPQDYDPPINNIGLVFLFIVVGVGLAGYAAAQTSK